MILPAEAPLTKRQLDEIRRDQQAEMDLHTLVEAEKIKRDPERVKAALEKRRKMQAELNQIAPEAPAPIEVK